MKNKQNILRLAWRFMVALVFLILLTFWILYMRRDKAVIVTFGHSSIYDHHNHQFLNPFRDRTPEFTAIEFLRGILGNCTTILTTIKETPQRVQDTCDRELNYPLKSWQLRAREDEGNSAVVLRYKVTRLSHTASSATTTGPFWIWVKNEGGKWQVTGYEAWY